MLSALLGGWKAWVAAAGMALLSAAVFLIRKSGEDAQKLRQAKIDAEAGQIITHERVEARSASDEALNRKVDEWSRK